MRRTLLLALLALPPSAPVHAEDAPPVPAGPAAAAGVGVADPKENELPPPSDGEALVRPDRPARLVEPLPLVAPPPVHQRAVKSAEKPVSVSPAVHGACDARALDELRAAAQAQAESTPRMAEAMLTCPGGKDEVLLWLSFYYRARGEYAKSAHTGSQMHPTAKGASGRDAVFAKAVGGDYEELERRISAGEPGYGGDAEATLLLARSYVRGGHFEEGRGKYSRYLELKGDDNDVRIESAYSYVWEGVYDEAERRFNELLRQGMTSQQEEGARRGIALVQQRRDVAMNRAVAPVESAAAAPAGEASTPISVSPGAEYFTSTDDFFRKSLLLSVESRIVNLGGSFDNLLSNKYNEHLNAVEGYVTKYARVGSGHLIGAKAGVFSANRIQGLFELRIDPQIDDSWRPMLGAYQLPMARDIPLPPELTYWVRQGAFGGISYQDLLEYRFDIRRTTESGGSTRHFAQLRFGLDRSRAPAEHLDLLIQGENESNDQASPFFYSPDNVFVLGAGLDLKKQFSNRFRGDFQGIYGYANESRKTAAGNLGTGTSRYQLASTLDFTYRKNLAFGLQGRLIRSTSDSADAFYNATLLALTLTWKYE